MAAKPSSFFFVSTLAAVGLFASASLAHAASLNIEPSAGTFTVGATFTASVTVDTQGVSVNTFETVVKFPADKIQVVSPATGQSITSVWVGQPTFDNQNGTITLRGGIPNGIITSHGVIATFTFRARNVGDAYIQIGQDSQVLANDGKATNVLQSENGAVFHIALPPSAGPNIASPTHPDQNQWYSLQGATLTWEAEPGATGYSYVLSQNPLEVPDNISEGNRTSVAYDNLQSGTWYFTIKSLHGSEWGGVSHFALHVDRDPPAAFSVDIVSGARTTETRPVVQFFTTDALSGIDHYEMKIVPLSDTASTSAVNPLFIEVQSPYVAPQLALGTYDVIVHAIDKAGNVQSSTQRLEVVSGLGRIAAAGGLAIGPDLVVPWQWVIAASLLLLILAAAYWYWRKRRHDRMHAASAEGVLPPDIKAQLEELRQYREKYAKAAAIMLVIFAALFAGRHALAQTSGNLLPPPITTNVSKDITNQEIFYIGGKAEPSTQVVVHLQNVTTGEVTSQEAEVDQDGNWFYRHSAFLPAGDYILWTQTQKGDVLSPPSPQMNLHVEGTALEFGVSRISYANLYFIVALFLLLWVAALLVSGMRYGRRTRKKEKQLLADARMIEERIRRGFAVLRKDIQAELTLLNGKDAATLLPEEKFRAEELQKDIDQISARIGEDVWELERDAVA